MLGAALLLLQVSDAADGLVVDLIPYGLIAAGVLIAAIGRRSSSGINFPCFALTAAFALYVAIRSITSTAPYAARLDLYLVLAALAVYALTAAALSRSTLRILLIVALLLFAVLHVLVGLVQFGLGENFKDIPLLQSIGMSTRATGLYRNPDHLAGLLEILSIFGVSIACWSRWPHWARVLVGYLALTCYIGIVLTGSRGGYLSALTSLIAFAVLSLIVLRGGHRRRFLTYGAIGLLFSVAAFFGARYMISQNALLSERLTNIVAADTGRFDLWHASIEQWKLQPLTGTGGATYRFYGRQFRPERLQVDPVYVHNDYLHLLCEYGALGALAFLLFFGAHLRRGWQTFVRFGPQRLASGTLARSDRLALNIGALSALGAYVVHSLVDFNLHLPANALLIAFVFGILANPGTTPESEIVREGATRILRLTTILLGAFLLVQCARLYPGEHYAIRTRDALENEQPAEAITLADKALTYEQLNPNILFYLGRALAALGYAERSIDSRRQYYDRALAAFDTARRLCPLDGTYPLDAAHLYDAMGRFHEAEWMYSLALARDPRSVAVGQLYQNHLRSWRRSK